MQSAAAYKRADGWYIHANSETTDGVSISSPPYSKLPLSASPTALGESVLKALAEFRQGVPHPTQWDDSYPIYELAGVKSWAAFKKGASYVAIAADDQWLTISPSRDAGPRSGYLSDVGEDVRIARAFSPHDIGDALIKAISLCA